MKFIKELRQYAQDMELDAWAVRQALVMTLEFDTITALGRPGITQKILHAFDEPCRQNARELAAQFDDHMLRNAARLDGVGPL